ncbi:amidohydrolase family protein [Maridesulfovibrio sp.]|uniref:amidohydrolase n=1 Tax=Maridesulfovibrio sp. TaxID=2795000 RepID=UPI002A186EC9|nr:amidohydrolase family protein [Maridesulfovibrio sp.]
MSDQTVSKLFVNGRIYQDAVRRVNNLLVEDDLVVAVDVDPSNHTDAEVIDLDGNALYPGFCDSHVHLVESALMFSGGDLRGDNNAESIVQAVKTAISKHSDEDPFFAGGFSLDNYDSWSLDDLAALDAVTGDRIVLLSDDLGHNLIINSAAINAADLSKHLDDVPSGGKVVVENGKPTGMLREEAMTLAGNPLLPRFTDASIQPGTQYYMNLWAQMGYTGIVDLMGAPIGRIMHADMCRKMESNGLLPLRVNYNYTFFGLDDLEGGLKEMGKDTDLVRFIGNKLFVDGAYAGGEAWTTWENKQGNHGLHTVTAGDSMGKNQNIYRIVARLEEVGLNCHYHIQGDEALNVTLDALEAAAAKKGGLSCVHTLIHLAFPRPDQLQRINKLNNKVVSTVQPGFWKAEAGLDRYYGKANDASYPIKELMEAGISTGMSTDFGVSPLELSAPTTIMNISMLGEGAARTPLTMQDVIRGLTQGSAATTGHNDVGALYPGMKADMVRFERDLYDEKPENLATNPPKVLETWISGKKVVIHETPK